MSTKTLPLNAADKVAQRMAEIRAKGVQRREATVVGVNREARTVELSFSSEVEYRRWYGIEILSHEPGACDLTRLNNKAPFLWMHDWMDQRGVVEPGTARIDSDRVGRCTVRLSKNPKGEELLNDIADGIVTKVSVGYQVKAIKLTEEREDVDVFTVTEWAGHEISAASVPADDTVGVGRSADQIPQEEPQARPENNPPNINERTPTTPRTQQTMNEKTLRDKAGNLVRAMVDANGAIVEVLEVLERAGADIQAAATRGADAERARSAGILALAKEYGQHERAMQFIADGKTPEDFQRELLHNFAATRSASPLSEQAAGANIGLTPQEVRSYSILRAVRALMPDASAADKKAAGFELEASRAAADLYGKQPKGIIIPNDVLADRSFMADRAFGVSAGNTGNGGAVVANNLLGGSFIDILRRRAWVMRRARTLTGLVGNVDIPKQTGSSQAYWVGEGGAPNASTPMLDQIGFTPKTVGAYVDITRRLLKQSTPDAEAITRDDLLKVMGLEVDRVCIYGTGGEFQPKGAANYSGNNAVAFTTPGSPSYAELVQMETEIALDNADVDSMSYAFNAGIRGKLKTTLKFPGVNGSAPIWEPGNTVNGYATDVTNQIQPGDVFFANWQDLVVAMWGGLELTVDPWALSTSGGIRLIALQDIDVNLRRNESFCVGR